MPGDDGSGTSKDFNECVTQDQLREAIEQGKEMKEVVAVTEPPTSEPQNSLFLSFFFNFLRSAPNGKAVLSYV